MEEGEDTLVVSRSHPAIVALSKSDPSRLGTIIKSKLGQSHYIIRESVLESLKKEFPEDAPPLPPPLPLTGDNNNIVHHHNPVIVEVRKVDPSTTSQSEAGNWYLIKESTLKSLKKEFPGIKYMAEILP